MGSYIVVPKGEKYIVTHTGGKSVPHTREFDTQEEAQRQADALNAKDREVEPTPVEEAIPDQITQYLNQHPQYHLSQRRICHGTILLMTESHLLVTQGRGDVAVYEKPPGFAVKVSINNAFEISIENDKVKEGLSR